MLVNERFARQFVVAKSITGNIKNNRNMILRIVKMTKKLHKTGKIFYVHVTVHRDKSL